MGGGIGSFFTGIFSGKKAKTSATVQLSQAESVTAQTDDKSVETQAGNDSCASNYYEIFGLDLSPDSARKLTYLQAQAKASALTNVCDRGDWCELSAKDDYSVLLRFNKTGGLFEAVVSSDSKTPFLGMCLPEPQKVWSALGYALEENLGVLSSWTNEDARIVVHARDSGQIEEIIYHVAQTRGGLESRVGK